MYLRVNVAASPILGLPISASTVGENSRPGDMSAVDGAFSLTLALLFGLSLASPSEEAAPVGLAPCSVRGPNEAAREMTSGATSETSAVVQIGSLTLGGSAIAKDLVTDRGTFELTQFGKPSASTEVPPAADALEGPLSDSVSTQFSPVRGESSAESFPEERSCDTVTHSEVSRLIEGGRKSKADQSDSTDVATSFSATDRILPSPIVAIERIAAFGLSGTGSMPHLSESAGAPRLEETMMRVGDTASVRGKPSAGSESRQLPEHAFSGWVSLTEDGVPSGSTRRSVNRDGAPLEPIDKRRGNVDLLSLASPRLNKGIRPSIEESVTPSECAETSSRATLYPDRSEEFEKELSVRVTGASDEVSLGTATDIRAFSSVEPVRPLLSTTSFPERPLLNQSTREPFPPRTSPNVDPIREESVKALPQSRIQGMTIRVDDIAGGAVDLRIRERGGQLGFSVRTADAEVASTLRRDLASLISDFDRSGMFAEAWVPDRPGGVATMPLPESSDWNASNRNRQPGQQQQSHHRPNRKPKGENNEAFADGKNLALETI